MGEDLCENSILQERPGVEGAGDEGWGGVVGEGGELRGEEGGVCVVSGTRTDLLGLLRTRGEGRQRGSGNPFLRGADQ
jgi:hypothetical protein